MEITAMGTESQSRSIQSEPAGTPSGERKQVIVTASVTPEGSPSDHLVPPRVARLDPTCQGAAAPLDPLEVSGDLDQDLVPPETTDRAPATSPGLLPRSKGRRDKAHHSAPCGCKMKDGRPCPNKATAKHPGYGQVCRFHDHRLAVDRSLDQTVSVRFSKDEHASLGSIARLRGLSLSSLLRAGALKLEMPNLPTPAIDAKALVELAKQGSNLNQAVRALNRIANEPTWVSSVHHQLELTRHEVTIAKKLLESVQRQLLEVLRRLA